MSEEPQLKFLSTNPNKLDLILLTFQRVQEDLGMAKCQIKTSIHEVSVRQSIFNNTLMELHRDFRDINERLHGLELTQHRQNSST